MARQKYLAVLQYFKCRRFGHTLKHCTHDAECRQKGHLDSQCQQNKKYVNCHEGSVKYGLRNQTKYSCWDGERFTLDFMLKRLKESTNYG